MCTVGDVQYHMGYHEYCGGVQYCGGYHILSTMGDIMIHVGGCHEKRAGCSAPWRYSNNKR